MSDANRSDPPAAGKTVSFGYRSVSADERQGLVNEVFTRVASRYDLMNDLMSGGLHRLWKDDLIGWLAPPKADRAFRLLDAAGGTGDVSESVLWKQTRGLPYVPSAILYRRQYVMVKDGGIVTAFDAKSGDQVYMQRGVEGGRYYASPVAANGHIYFTSLEDGVVTVVKAGLDKPEQVVQNPPLGERVAATPAIADDTLYVRTDGHLYAFGEKD